MKLFKDANNNIFAYELDGSQDHLIAPGLITITKDEADNLISEKQQESINNLTYAENRLLEYPPVGDQLDAMWKGGEAAAEMLAKVQEVKAKYPKG
jgi:hypothetical protein